MFFIAKISTWDISSKNTDGRSFIFHISIYYMCDPCHKTLAMVPYHDLLPTAMTNCCLCLDYNSLNFGCLMSNMLIFQAQVCQTCKVEKVWMISLFVGISGLPDLLGGEGLDDIEEPNLCFNNSFGQLSPPDSHRDGNSELPDTEYNTDLRGMSTHSPLTGRVSDWSNNNVPSNVSSQSGNTDLNMNEATESKMENVKGRKTSVMSVDWNELESSMQSLDDLLGKSKNRSGSPDILDLDLDDSFVPLVDGFKLEGGTPLRGGNQQPFLHAMNDADGDLLISMDNTPQRNVSGLSQTLDLHGINLEVGNMKGESDLMTRFRLLKEKTKQNLQNSTEYDA